MKTIRIALVIALVAVCSFLLGRQSAPAPPSVKFPAPTIAAVVPEGICTQVTHRYNPTTGRFEPVAHNEALVDSLLKKYGFGSSSDNDPLGIR